MPRITTNGAITMSKKTIKNTFAPVAKSIADTDYASLASSLVTAHETATTGIATAKLEAERAIASANSTLLERIKTIAIEFPNFTEALWNEHVKERISAMFKDAGHKMPGPITAKVKVAFLALSNGIEPDAEYANNAQAFVNKQARAELKTRGIIDAGETRGRPQGATETAPKGKNTRMVAAVELAQTGGVDPNTAKERARMLVHCTTAGNWKLLERALRDIMKLETV